jgi:chromosome partitioning protein
MSAVIAVIGQKGGTGKTTASLELAVAAHRAGQTVAIIDLDPQTNATNWKDRREGDGPAVVSAQPGRIRQNIDTAREHGADLVIVDTPGKNDTAAIEAARVADLVLIPTDMQIFNLETLPSVRDLLRIAGDPPAFVLLMKLHPQATKGAEDAKAMIEPLCGIKACPVHLSQRNTYKDAPSEGKTAQEIDEKATEEASKLYKFICEHVNMSTNEHANMTGSKHVAKHKTRRATKSA